MRVTLYLQVMVLLVSSACFADGAPRHTSHAAVSQSDAVRLRPHAVAVGDFNGAVDTAVVNSGDGTLSGLLARSRAHVVTDGTRR